MLDWASGGASVNAGRRRERGGLRRAAARHEVHLGLWAEALPFFKALAFHQTKEWFEDNRATYESCVKGPMGDFAEDAAAALARAKIPIKGDRKTSPFRIHRDVRFAKNKDPYKTNAGVAMTRSGSRNDPGVLYFHLSPEECFFAAGFYRLDPPLTASCATPRRARPRPISRCSRSSTSGAWRCRRRTR